MEDFVATLKTKIREHDKESGLEIEKETELEVAPCWLAQAYFRPFPGKEKESRKTERVISEELENADGISSGC